MSYEFTTGGDFNSGFENWKKTSKDLAYGLAIGTATFFGMIGILAVIMSVLWGGASGAIASASGTAPNPIAVAFGTLSNTTYSYLLYIIVISAYAGVAVADGRSAVRL